MIGNQSAFGGPHVNGALTVRAYMATQFMAARLSKYGITDEAMPIEAEICILAADTLLAALEELPEPPKKDS